MSSKEIIEHFSARSAIYNETKWVNNEEILLSILNCIKLQPNSIVRILDLGAGTGAVSKYILKNCQFKVEIVAVDICESMLQQIKEPEILKCVSEIEEMPFLDNSFDVVVSRQCLHYVENLNNVILEIKRVLKKDGVFVLSQFVPYESETKKYWKELMQYRQPLRKLFYSEKDWIDIFTLNGFELQSTERYLQRYSFNKWKKAYHGTKSINMEKYIKLIENAPQKYIDEYNIIISEGDIHSTALGVTIGFKL